MLQPMKTGLSGTGSIIPKNGTMTDTSKEQQIRVKGMNEIKG